MGEKKRVEKKYNLERVDLATRNDTFTLANTAVVETFLHLPSF